MRMLYVVGGLVLTVAALAPVAAAQCTSAASTTDLAGVAQVTQYEAACSYYWGTTGLESNVKGVGVQTEAASANAELWKFHYFGGWDTTTYDYLDRWVSVYGSAAGYNVQADAGVGFYHYDTPTFCLDGVYAFAYLPPESWGGWWGAGPGNDLLPPMEAGAFADLPCAGVLPLPPTPL